LKTSAAYIAGLQLWNAFPKADCCVQKGMAHFQLKQCFMLESSGEFFLVTRKMLSGFKIILAFMENNSEQFC